MVDFDLKLIEGWGPAIWGMRHPLQSYDKSDSGYIGEQEDFFMGEADYDLAKRLCMAGSDEHAKFLRMIQVWVDVTAPVFFFSEFDTYKVGTTANSQSTMHTLSKTGVTEPDIQIPWGVDQDIDMVMVNYIDAINNLVNYRYKNCEDKELKKKYFEYLKGMLPSGWRQTRMVNLNYQVLRTMYRQRKNHRLSGWSEDFVNFVHTLPFSEFITGEWPEEKTLTEE